MNSEAPGRSSRCAIIYTHSLLVGSMTFIKSHAESLQAYHAVYAGAHRVNGLRLPEERTFVANNGGLSGFIKEYLFREWGKAAGLVDSLRKQNPAIVHAHFGTSGPAAMLLARKLNVPLVVTFHGRDATMKEEEAMRSRRGRELLRSKTALMAYASTFIAVSSFVRQNMLAQGYPEEKIVIQHNGIDLDFFHPPEKRSQQPVILFVGRFVEKKGARYLIDAARVLHKEGLDFELVMIGDGPFDKELATAAKRAGIRCQFPGFLPIEEVRAWIGKATVVAVPSITAADGDSEGLPTILLEAQAMETAIVATRHSGIPDGVRDGVTAELVREKDVAALANSLRSFITSPEKAAAFGKAGRAFVTQNFALPTQIRRLEHIYSTAIESFRPGGST